MCQNSTAKGDWLKSLFVDLLLLLLLFPLFPLSRLKTFLFLVNSILTTTAVAVAVAFAQFTLYSRSVKWICTWNRNKWTKVLSTFLFIVLKVEMNKNELKETQKNYKSNNWYRKKTEIKMVKKWLPYRFWIIEGAATNGIKFIVNNLNRLANQNNHGAIDRAKAFNRKQLLVVLFWMKHVWWM